MEAKDTVIKYHCKHQVTAGSIKWHMIDGYNMGAKAQAEISFKAGIKEVFDFFHENSAGIMMNEHALEAKLKEWGLEEEEK